MGTQSALGERHVRRSSVTRWIPALVLLWSCPIFAEELVFDAGQDHFIRPDDAECFEDTFEEPEDTIAKVKTQCSVGDGTANVSVVASGVLKQAFFHAASAFQVEFKVRQAGEGEEGRSFVPIQFHVPITYAARIRNDAITGGIADFQIFLRLSSFKGATTVSVPILNARHNGIGDCLTIPTSKIDVAEAVVKCALGVQQLVDVAEANVTLSAIVETGRPYQLELRMEARTEKGFGLAELLAVRSGRCDGFKPNCFPPDEEESTPGMAWFGAFVTVGTDAEEIAARLQEQIDELREDLERHTHIFLTGRGAGHNNTEAVTSSALIPLDEPADDMDGVASTDDLCPGTPEGAEIDAIGCELDAFCSLQERISTCSSADWHGDEPRNPRDCRWRGGACEAR